ncbi:hypothetical protein [Chryseobacterium koreense]|uniref:hypothetical protein n=1 Tax=Chryseobacterium koreense TaxID=232216 RepID=UPI0026E9A7DF|nr:hypothetical protein [Chryseobacterium koreense]
MPTNPLETRIKEIQKKLSVTQTGIYDPPTCKQLELLLGGVITDFNLEEKKKNIQKLLGFTGKAIDGIFGVNTTTKIEMFLTERLPAIPSGARMIVSKKSLELVIESEISSRASYNSKYKFPIWPQGNSGITIGIGYDLGYVSKPQFEKDWKNSISNDNLTKLKAVIGLKGDAAKNALNASLKKIEIPYDNAIAVFYVSSVPDYARETANVYPGVELLPPDAQGALLSLVYNRGGSLVGDTRIEMKNIAALVKSKNLSGIANEIRKMKRLWQDKPSMRGLLLRREREAILVENANYFVRAQDYIFA